jgi:hypothetical protein
VQEFLKAIPPQRRPISEHAWKQKEQPRLVDSGNVKKLSTLKETGVLQDSHGSKSDRYQVPDSVL